MTEIRGLLVSPDGKVATYKQELSLGFQPMYRAMGCSIVERLQLGSGLELWLDEDAVFDAKKKVNRLLSGLVLGMTKTNHRIIGTGIVLGTDKEGEMASIDPASESGIRFLLSVSK